MKNISDAADLIATARETLLQDLLPALPPHHRYAGLMIANVMAIAGREHALGPATAARETTRLRLLVVAARPEWTGASGAVSPDEDLAALRQALSAAIRSGSFDDATRAAELATHLVQTAADWLAISNPKSLRPDRAV